MRARVTAVLAAALAAPLLAPRKEDILRLDVAMDDVPLVQMLHRARHLPQQDLGLGLAVGSMSLEARLQVAAHDELHDEIDADLGRDQVDQLHDVGMGYLLQDLRFGWLKRKVLM